MEFFTISLICFFTIRLLKSLTLAEFRGTAATPPIHPPVFSTDFCGAGTNKRTRQQRDADPRPTPPPSPSLRAYGPSIAIRPTRFPSPERAPLGNGDFSSLRDRTLALPERAPLRVEGFSTDEGFVRIRRIAASAFQWREAPPTHQTHTPDLIREVPLVPPALPAPLPILYAGREEREDPSLFSREPSAKRPREARDPRRL